MAEQETTTRFTYNVSWIISEYLSAYILALTAAADGDPGAHTPFPFNYLINELDPGCYNGRALPRPLQNLLTARTGICAALASAAALPPPAPCTIDGYGQSGGGDDGGGRDGGGVIVPRGRRRNERNGEVIPNPCPTQRIYILSGENTRGM